MCLPRPSRPWSGGAWCSALRRGCSRFLSTGWELPTLGCAGGSWAGSSPTSGSALGAAPGWPGGGCASWCPASSAPCVVQLQGGWHERCVWGRGLAGDNCLSPARVRQGGFLLPGLSLLPEMLSRPGAGREAVPCQAAEADAFHL